MTQGLLGKAALVANTYTGVYAVTAGKSATANIRVVNNDLVNPVTVRLYVCPSTWARGTAGALADIIEPLDLVIQAGRVLEEIGVAMSAGEQVVAFSPSNTVTVRVHGFEN